MGPVESPTEFCRQRLLALWEEWRAKGGNQSTLATACGVAQGQISLWLKDLKAGVVPRVQSLEVLCRGFDVTLASLFPGSAAVTQPALPASVAAFVARLARIAPDDAELSELTDLLDDIETARSEDEPDAADTKRKAR